jgi:type II secretory pathway component PulF
MQQFTFVATDMMGNQIAGTVFANDMVNASEQVKEMGYQPLKVEMQVTTTPEQPLAVPSIAPSLEPKMDLTEVPTRTLLNADIVPEESGRVEAWERGGQLPVESIYSQPAVRLSASGQVIKPTPAAVTPLGQIQPTTTGYSGRAHIDRPLAPSKTPTPSFTRLLQETLIYPIFSGVVLKELVPFYRQFATLINAGLSIYQSLTSLEASTKNEKLKEIARAGMKQVEAGGRFSEVMARYPWIFSQMQLEMVRAAEEGGLLDQVLRHLADYVEHELEMKRMISRETFYPKLVLFVALMIMGRTGLSGGDLAIVGLVVNGTGAAYLANTLGFGGAALGVGFGLYALFRLFFFNVGGVREAYDGVKLSIPVVGNIVRQFALARFARCFAALYRGGFSIPRALEISGRTSGNAVIEKAVHRAIGATQQGQLASDSFRASGLFPHMILDMLRTGEMTGGLDEMMDKSADYFESEAKLKSHQAALVFGVIIFLMVALLVGRAVISGYVGLEKKTMTVPENF